MSDRPPGRDQGEALLRLVRILTLLANSAPEGVNRDYIIESVGYRAAGMNHKRDELRRDLTHLRRLGWRIDTDGAAGELARLRLVDQDPRLATLLTAEQVAELRRAALAGGMDPEDLGLPKPPPTTSGGRPGDADVRVSLRTSDAFLLETTLHAMQHRCLLHVTYSDRERILEVDRVFQTSTGRWRVVARQDGQQKQFRLDRFQAMRADLPGTAGPIHPDLSTQDPLEYPDGEPITAVVAVAKEHERQAVRELGRPLERTERPDVVELRIRVVNRPLWRVRLYQLGERVKLLGPDEMREEVRVELTAFASGGKELR